MTRPGDFCFLPDERIVIADLPGELRMFVESTRSTLSTVGTVPSVTDGGERGLLSVIADPSFAANGYIYVLYTSSITPTLHLDRFTCLGDLSNPKSTNLSFSDSSRYAILELPQTSNAHSGGSARFGPDGKLYVTVGDAQRDCRER